MAKILVFSDTHLTHEFEPAKFALLLRIITEHDLVIINGDFWDCWFTKFDRFICSPWKELFPLLRKKKTVYIHGNHDPASACTADMRLFSVSDSDAFTFVSGRDKFSCTHGHLLVNGKRSTVLEFYGHVLDRMDGTGMATVLHWILRYIEFILVYIFGVDTLSHTRFFQSSNHLMKLSQDKSTQWLLAGHSHYDELDQQHRYANSGFMKYGSASYLSICDGVVTLIKTNY